MKSLYILLTRARTMVAKLVRLTTSDLYTHAALSFEADLKPLYSFARTFSRLMLPAGFHRENLREGIYKRQSTMRCAVYELEVSDRAYQAAQQEVEQMERRAWRYRFSIVGLVLCRLHIPWHRKYHYFCSQFVGEILQTSGALVLPREPSLMRPNDYAGLPELNCRYEGKLCDLLQTI